MAPRVWACLTGWMLHHSLKLALEGDWAWDMVER